MDVVDPRALLRPFADLPDPRAHNIIHPLANLLLIAILAVLCGADNWHAVERFARAKARLLKRLAGIEEEDIPSHDTLRRLFAALDPNAFEGCFMDWAGQLVSHQGGRRRLAIDGKSLRGSADAAGDKAAIHLVSVFCQRNHLVLGQLATDIKSNEITAIPKLLELLDLSDAVVTSDAMGCQKDIAAKIVEGGGDYLLAVKDNHPTLHEEVDFLFTEAKANGFDMPHSHFREELGKDHGRIESRECWAVWDIEWFADKEQWKGLRSFVCVEATREVQGQRSVERRHYLSSLDGRDAKALLEAIRGHWGVENRLHWSLDVSFDEDARRLRKDHGPENFSRLDRIALNLLRKEKTLKASIATKRLNCGWDERYLLKVLLNLG